MSKCIKLLRYQPFSSLTLQLLKCIWIHERQKMYTRLVLGLLLTGLFLVASSKRTVCQVDENCLNNDTLISDYATTYPQCANNIDSFEQPSEDIFRDLICDATCGPLYELFVIERCTNPLYWLVTLYQRLLCVVNEDGRLCYSFYLNSRMNMSVANSEAVAVCTPALNSNCSNTCATRLNAIKDHYGSCINLIRLQ